MMRNRIVRSVSITLFFLGISWWIGLGRANPSPTSQSGTQDSPVFLGACACARCHSEKHLGNQFQIWATSDHARAYLVLATGDPNMIDPAAKGFAYPGFGKVIAQKAASTGKEQNCLLCHATGEMISTIRGPEFVVQDGVQCESCHGPGSQYIEWMQTKYADDQKSAHHLVRPLMPGLDMCETCHSPKTSHDVMQAHEFEPFKAWKAIEHPLLKGSDLAAPENP